MPIIHWFRRDLRLYDNTALSAALKDSAGDVIPVFIFDNALLRGASVAPARIHFLLDCLHDIDSQLRDMGSRLIIRKGNIIDELTKLIHESAGHALYYNRDYTPTARQRDTQVTKALMAIGCSVKSFKDQVIHEGTEVVTKEGNPFTIFTPFKRAWMSLPKPVPVSYELWTSREPHCNIADLPVPHVSDMRLPVAQLVPRGGESEANSLLNAFIDTARISQYVTDREFPGEAGTSRLSPHLRFGSISPRICYQRALDTLSHEFPASSYLTPGSNGSGKEGADAWINELIWREFYQQVLYNFPHADRNNFNRAYDGMHWGSGDMKLDQFRFTAWCEGRTGYPIVDAGMRELNQTAWMHNRTRMIVASFLTKDLLLDWRMGESYFMRQLVDGDPAANNGGWQWAAGTGTDAQPYFRVFNPVIQSKHYDPGGRYIRAFIPELAAVPDDYIHEPWKMPMTLQAQIGCTIGRDYPSPIVDHATQRNVILRKFKEVRS